jgi:hypothetical protein
MSYIRHEFCPNKINGLHRNFILRNDFLPYDELFLRRSISHFHIVKRLSLREKPIPNPACGTHLGLPGLRWIGAACALANACLRLSRPVGAMSPVAQGWQRPLRMILG